MKMPRMISASTMPTSSALCWTASGTANLLMMIRKMNRLSTEREYSVSQPAKNSVPYWCPAKNQTPMPKRTAIPTKNAERNADLLAGGFVRPTADDRRRRRSGPRVVMPIVSHHTRGDTSMLCLRTGFLRARAAARAGCLLSGGLFRRCVATDDPGSDLFARGLTVVTRSPRRNTPLQRRAVSQTWAPLRNGPAARRPPTPREPAPRRPRQIRATLGRRAPTPRRTRGAPCPR